MSYENIIYEVKETTAWITINRAKAMNALSTGTLKDFSDALDVIEADDAVRVVVITGDGDKAFSAGADLKEIQALKVAGSFNYSRAAHRVFDRIEKFCKPVIACINGLALGGGAELAVSCHLRIAGDKAKIMFPESGLGGVPGMGGTQRLPRLIGKSRALYYLLTGAPIKAEEGLQYGLIQQVAPMEELAGAAEKLAQNLAQKSPVAMNFIIQAVTSGLEGHQDEGLVMEAVIMAAMTYTEDKKEGIGAMFEKRPPVFKGE